MLNSLLLSGSYPPNSPGGIANYFFELARNWPAGSMSVLTGWPRSEWRDEPVPRVYRLNKSDEQRNAVVKTITRLSFATRVIQSTRTSLIHSAWAIPDSYLVCLAHSLLRVQHVLYFFGNDVLQFARDMEASTVVGWWGRQLIKRAYAFVACSDFTKHLAIERIGLPAQNVIVCRPGVSDSFLAHSASPPVLTAGRRTRLLSIGRLVARKGFDRVIQSMPILLQNGYDIEYTIVGGGDQAPLRELAESNGVSDRVTFRGFLSGTKELITEFESSDVFIMPSREECGGSDVEGFGIVYLEAAAMCRPAIGGNSGGVGEAIVDGTTGLLVRDPDSPHEIADCVMRLIQDTEWTKSLAVAGRRRAETEFAWPSVASNLAHELAKRAHAAQS